MTGLRTFFAQLGAWLGRRDRGPAPRRRTFEHRPCAFCGRTVAHTREGLAWRHRCADAPHEKVP